jgi:hypothetical protein
MGGLVQDNTTLAKSLKKIATEITGKQDKIVEDVELMQLLNFVDDYNFHNPPSGFLRTTEGLKTYFMYVLQKHKNVGFSINKNLKKMDEDSIGWKFDVMKDDNYIYSNYYEKGIKKNDEYNKIELDIDKCIKAGKRFMAIPLTILFNKNSAHQNMIILDLQKKTAERFEPHGDSTGNEEKYSDKINILLKQQFEKDFKNSYKYKYIFPSDLCPRFTKEFINQVDDIDNNFKDLEGKGIGYQTFENKSSLIGEQGYCMTWSLFYLDSRLTAPNYTPTEIHTNMFKKFKSDPQKFLNFIRGYTKFLVDFKKKLFQEFINLNPEFKSVVKMKKNKKNKSYTEQNYKDIFKMNEAFEIFIHNMLLQFD